MRPGQLLLSVLLFTGCARATNTWIGSQEAVPDFSLEDTNPNSVSLGQEVAPREFLGRTSAWYFGHAT